MAVSKEGKAAAPAGGGPSAAQEEDEFYREIKITRPFDMKPIADGTASVLDEKVQEEICRFVTGTVRLASRKFVIPDVLIFFNGGVTVAVYDCSLRRRHPAGKDITMGGCAPQTKERALPVLCGAGEECFGC